MFRKKGDRAYSRYESISANYEEAKATYESIIAQKAKLLETYLSDQFRDPTDEEVRAKFGDDYL